MLSCALVLLIGLTCASSASAQGVISGTVTDSSGPVANMRVLISGGNGSQFPRSTNTDNSGHYAIEAWPDTYRVAAMPPSGSADGFVSTSSVVVSEGGTSVADLSLPLASVTGHLSGVASYPDHSPDAGLEVRVLPERFESGPIRAQVALTDESGNWDIGNLPTGIYQVSYWVTTGGNLNQQYPVQAANSELIWLDAGQIPVLNATMTGPKPGAGINGTVISAEGWPSREAQLEALPVGGSSLGTVKVKTDGTFRIYLPSGTYRLTASGGEEEDDGTGETTISVTGGQLSSPTIQMSAKPVPGNISARNSQQDLAWLNQQRAQWGLPAGLAEVPVWSQACAAHDAYGVRNKVLDHPERANLPGHSLGGEWAGLHSILAGGGPWNPEQTPWNDAPIHFDQLMTPGISVIGLDDNGQQCATTWPGILRTGIQPGTIFTFPGDGTTGLPPAEDAEEGPTTPNKELGVPNLAGRELFIYEFGTETPAAYGYSQPQVLSASLTSSSGSVPVKWADGDSSIGGYLTGAIIVPTEQLQPFTTYTATVKLGGAENFHSTVPALPPVTHTWSFKTGHANPGGAWDGSKETSKKRAPRRRVHASWKSGHVVVKGWNFKAGQVVIKRKVLLRSKRRFDGRVLARAKVSAKGKFIARFRWPKRHVAFRVYQGGKATFGIYNPPKPPKHQGAQRSAAGTTY